MTRSIWDINMPGPGDTWSEHTPFDDSDDCLDCGGHLDDDGDCAECDERDAHADDKLDEMRERYA